MGDAVGNPVVATDPNALTGGDADSFSIDKKTGQVRVAKALDHEAGATSGDGVYVITVQTRPARPTPSITATEVDEAPRVGQGHRYRRSSGRFPR